MAVTLVGSGGLFKKIGLLAGWCANANALKGGTATTPVAAGASWTTFGTNLETYAAESPSVSDQLGDHYQSIDSVRSGLSTLYQTAARLAQNITIKQVNADTPILPKDTQRALEELIRQMRAAGTSIQESTVAAGAQTALGSPVGNPVAVVSLKNARGDVIGTTFAETLRLTCRSDSLSGGATARQEGFTVNGKTAETDVYSHLWPAGSGCNVSLNLVDAALNNSGGNKLYNSDFETFTTNYPEDWTIQVGAAGTDVFAGGSSDEYIGANCLLLTGDGATLITLYQEFNKAHSTTSGAGGTPATLSPGKQYAVFGKVKVSAAIPATGVLRVALVNSAGTVINDDFGTANSFDVDLTTQTTAYATFSGSFRTPSNLPAVYRLELQTTTAIESGEDAYIDSLAMTEMTELYTGGPSIAMFSGSTTPVVGSAWTIAVTNTMGVMASWCERFFGMMSKRLVFPVSGSPTVADSLVT
jgi:hypothetical protein